MPYQQLNLNEAASYLHISSDELERIARKGDIPSRISQNRFVFLKRELHDWQSKRLLDCRNSVESINNNAKALKEPSADQPFLSQFLMEQTIDMHFAARTRDSVLRALASLAMKSNCVSDEKEYYELIKQREGLGTTGLTDGVAVPHSRIHDSYLLYDSFLVIACARSKLPFGSLDGKMTDLFIMPCANDDRVHLYMLARIALLLDKTEMANAIRDCSDPYDVLETITTIEAEFVSRGR